MRHAERKQVKNTSSAGFEVVYEDNHLILVIKPFNIPTQSDKSGDPDLLTMVKKRLKEKYSKPGEVFLGMVHRLDRPVGGLCLFAKTSKAASRLSEQLRERKIRKEYVAVVIGTPREKRGSLTHYLAKDREKNRVSAYKNPKPDAKKAELEYEVTKSQGGLCQLLVKPRTGRSHQIRAQLAAIGHPIVGDLKYGAKEPTQGKNILLYATRLEFIHPVTKEEMEFEIEPPKGWGA
ncbi:MAG: RluA family pseudouridine synthase [Nitrospinae bacterium]|nr:RluA family pseudouridine synthase [Nitrospinota bacterium]